MAAAAAAPSPPRGPGDVRYFNNARGERLCYEVFAPAPQAGGPGSAVGGDGRESLAGVHLVYLHGVHESADTMAVRHLAHYVRDTTLYVLEHTGHGRSYGTRGVVPSFDVLVDDAHAFVREVVVPGLGGGVKFAVIGHSMGGAVATYLCNRIVAPQGGSDARGCPMKARLYGGILLAPALSGGIPNAVVRGALRCVSCIAPSAGLGPPEDPSKYATGSGLDLNFCGKMPARTCLMFVDMFLEHKAAVDAWAAADTASGTPATPPPPFTTAAFPALVLHGDRDGAVPLAGNRPIYAWRGGGGGGARVEVLKGEGHDILISKHLAVYMALIRRWLGESATHR